MRVAVLLITGPVGVGKSSVLSEIQDLLQAAGIRFAAVELDALSYCHPPASDDDRFRTNLTFRNLAVVWRNFRAAGAERLILASVLESRDELGRCRRAVPERISPSFGCAPPSRPSASASLSARSASDARGIESARPSSRR